jgi:uncharacterized protein (DUF433 family)
MMQANDLQPTVVRTPGGLFIAGTRITLYDVIDYLAADWPPHLIRQWLNLTEQQMTDVLQYIGTHRAALETEYQQVLQQAEDIRHYWDERNRKRFAHIAAQPPKPDHKVAQAKLQAWKAKLDQTCQPSWSTIIERDSLDWLKGLRARLRSSPTPETPGLQ